jgi:hypothetical protein
MVTAIHRLSRWLIATLACLALSAGAARADCSFQLLGSAAPEGDHINVPSVGLNGGAIVATLNPGITFATLTQLSTEYNLTADAAGGGSPRFSVGIDTNGDGTVDGYLHIYFGTPPNFNDPAAGWQSTGNLIGNADKRFDLLDFGGPFYGTYSQALALLGNKTVKEIYLIADGGWSQPGNAQTVLFRNEQINACAFPTVFLTATPSTVAQGGPLMVSWTAPPGSSSLDWIGLYKVGDPNTAFGTWFYTGGTTSGSRTITAPQVPGQYEFRYLVNNSFNSVGFSNKVTVTSGAFTLSASPGSVPRGGTINVSWTAPPGRPTTDWIGLYKVGDPNQLWQAFQYTGGATSGTVNFTAPFTPGQYEFRYLLENGFNSVATSNTVTVGP